MPDPNDAATAYVPGGTMEEVKPGSADDPLASDETRAAAAAASGAAPAPAAPTAPEGTGGQAPPPTPATPEPTLVAPAPAPAAPPEGAALSEEEAAALGRLDSFVDEKVAGILRESKANADRVITKLSEGHKVREAELTERVRSLETHGLSDEEKKTLTDRYALEDRETHLKEYNEELDEQHQDILVARLSLEYSPFGVKEGDLQSKTVEEMELYCAQRKADYFEEQAKNAGVKPVNPAAPATAPAPQPPAETPKETPGGAAPAGATAPSDTGANAPAPGEKEFDKSMGREAMQKNLDNIPVESVDTGKRA